VNELKHGSAVTFMCTGSDTSWRCLSTSKLSSERFID